jgi:AcrR family transcriptional regulator
MATQTKPTAEPRIPLSRERVLQAAVTIADEEGIESLTMRHLAEELGVEAMSLYYHVVNKEAILDGVIEAIVEEIEEAAGGFEVPTEINDWKSAVRGRILLARQVMLRHPWAPGVIETRTNQSLAAVRYFEGLLGLLREGGFTYDLAHHAMHALGSRALGFAQELFEPDDTNERDEGAAAMLGEMADQFPYIVAMLGEIAHDDPDSTLGWCDDQVEFEFSLDLILDGLEKIRVLRVSTS